MHTLGTSLMVSCVQTGDITGRPCAVLARGITKCLGDVAALDAVDLDVAAGQIHGVVGPNGAGKTTLFGLLLGLAVADRGTLEVLGTPVGRAPAAPDGVTGFVDGPGLYPSPMSPATRYVASPSGCISGSGLPSPCSPAKGAAVARHGVRPSLPPAVQPAQPHECHRGPAAGDGGM
jgi:hypothetical protein